MTKLHRVLYACICAVLLCSFAGVVYDSEAQLDSQSLCEALDMSSDDCAMLQSITFDPPERPWRVTTATAVAGDSSLRSGDIGRDQQSCLVLGLALPVNSVISVAGRGSFRSIDQLQIDADNLRLNTIYPDRDQTERDWTQESYFLPAAITTLRWCYIKDAKSASFPNNIPPTFFGSDAAWIDNLSFSASNISYQSRICAALDLTAGNCSMIQSIRYEPPQSLWIITSETSVAGGSSLHSADIPDASFNIPVCLVLGLSLPINSMISAAGRTSSEGGFNQLRINVGNNLRLDTISAATLLVERDWRQQSYFLPTAINTLRFCYLKEDSQTFGSDRVWVDNLSFSTSNISYRSRVCAALDLTDLNCAQIGSISYEPPQSLWIITSATSVVGGSSLRSADISNNQQSCLVLELSLPANSVISVAGRTHSQGAADRLQIDADDLRLDTLSAEAVQDFLASDGNQIVRNWSYENYFLPATISTLRFCYVKNNSVTRGFDAAWIDSLSFNTSDISYQSRVCTALDLTAGRCSLIQSIAYDPPQLQWIITSATSIAGGTSLRSADIGSNQSTCLNLELELELPSGSQVGFSHRLSTESNSDILHFEAGGQRLDSFTPAGGQLFADWQAETYELTSAITTMSWCYTKNSFRDVGNDSIWIDSLTFVHADIAPFCNALDLPAGSCALLRSVTYNPPQNRWETTTDDPLRGASALISPPIDAGQSACVSAELQPPLPAGSNLAFAWRVTSQSEQDILLFQTDTLQRQISNAPQWQTEYIELDSPETTLSWCYSKNSSADSQDTRAWLDSLLLVTPTDRYRIEIAVITSPTLVSSQTDTLQYTVAVSVESSLLPPPADWVLIVSGADNIVAAETTYSLSFDNNVAQVEIMSTPDNPFLPSTVLLALADRPSFFGATATSISYSLPVTELAMLQLMAPTAVTQTALDAPLEIVVTVAATDNFGRPFNNPEGVTLNVSAVDNASVPQTNYALTFAANTAQTTITVGFTNRGLAGSIEVSVTSGDINSTASVTLNPVPRTLASITLSAANSNLALTMANTAVNALLTLSALDNYGDPFEAGNVSLQLSASNNAIVQPSLIVAVESSGSAQQAVAIQPQNDRDTTVTVLILRGTLDQSVQLLPDGGLQIAVRALRILRQLQLSLADRTSPLQQVDSSLPIRADIRLIGLDQFDQPVTFTGVMFTVTADPMGTQAALDPPQLAATQPAGALTELVVMFPDTDAMPTTITIEIASPGTGVTANELVVRVLPDLRPPVQKLNIDDTDTDVTALDLVVALRWLADEQSRMESQAANLTINDTNITTTGIENLQQLVTNSENLDRIDLNRDGRADQLDLRILVRYMAGLRGGELAEQRVSTDIIRLLLGQ